MRLEELKNMLLSRNYKTSIINAAIEKAVSIPRSEAIEKVVRKKDPKPCCFCYSI